MPTAAAALPREIPAVNDIADAEHVASLPVVARRDVAPLRSLFWRIFLWFWLAAVLLTCAVATVVYITDPDQFFPRGRFVPLQMIDRLAAASVAVYERSGSDGLKSHLAGLPPTPASGVEPNSPGHFDRAYLFDAETGAELAGQTSRIDPRDIVARAKSSPDLQIQRQIGRIYMAHAISSTRDPVRRYVFLLSMPRSSLLQPTTPQAVIELGAALLVSALVCYWLASSVLTPLRQLRAATRELASGNLAARISPTGGLVRRGDEFSVLASDFNDMAARIEDLLTAQKRLIADISHEVGSPLTRLNVALGLAFRKSPNAAHPELERIQTEAGRVNELIRQLLLISELENGNKPEPVESIELRAMVSEIAADAEFEAGARQCRVVVEAAAPLEAQGVRHLLRSAVENVVRNAVRYTSASSEVRIELGAVARTDAETPQRCAVIRVRDRGPGVAEPELANLFRPFYRVSEARDRQSGGTGLGLAITQRAVAAHGGTVRARNVAAGGLMVEIVLPIA